ncbi:MAG: flippase [Microcoleaceae cyanobacterium]
MTQTFSSPAKENLNLGVLAREAGIALVIQFGGILLTYLAQIFLARWMGRTEYGIYEYVVSWSILLAIPAGLGLPHTVLRFVSEYQVKEEWGLLRGIVVASWLITILASLLVSLITISIILLLNYYYNFVYTNSLLIGIGLILLQALVNLQLETARAIKDVTLAYSPSQIISPILLICGTFLVLETHHSLTGIVAIALSEITLLVVILLQFGFLLLKLNKEFVPCKPVYMIREWLGVAMSILLQHGCIIMLGKTDIVMVGSILGPEQAGMYAVAVKTAEWVSFILAIINVVAAPNFTALYVKGNLEGLQKLVSTVAVWIFWPSIIISLLLFIFGQSVLGIFGSEFIAASWQLKILVLGNLINALSGSVGYLMMMTGHQNKSLKVFGYSAVLNIVLNAIFIPLFGSLGAAIATAFTVVVWNIWLFFLVVKYVGVNPSIFRGIFSLPKKAN